MADDLGNEFDERVLETMRKQGLIKDNVPSPPPIRPTLKLKFRCNQCGRNVPNIGATCDGCGCAIIGRDDEKKVNNRTGTGSIGPR